MKIIQNKYGNKYDIEYACQYYYENLKNRIPHYYYNSTQALNIRDKMRICYNCNSVLRGNTKILTREKNEIKNQIKFLTLIENNK